MLSVEQHVLLDDLNICLLLRCRPLFVNSSADASYEKVLYSVIWTFWFQSESVKFIASFIRDLNQCLSFMLPSNFRLYRSMSASQKLGGHAFSKRRYFFCASDSSSSLSKLCSARDPIFPSVLSRDLDALSTEPFVKLIVQETFLAISEISAFLPVLFPSMSF